MAIENTAAADIFIGQSDVTIAGARRGLKVVSGAIREFSLGAGDKLYAVTAVTADVVVLRTEA